MIANTTTSTGLKIQAELDTNAYLKGRKVSDEELALVQIGRDAFHGEWNYTIKPQKHSQDFRLHPTHSGMVSKLATTYGG